MRTIRLERASSFVLLFICLFLSNTINAQTSSTLDVEPGTLQDLLLDLDYSPTKLILKGTLNATDLDYINKGTGKISNVMMAVSACAQQESEGIIITSEGVGPVKIGMNAKQLPAIGLKCSFQNKKCAFDLLFL